MKKVLIVMPCDELPVPAVLGGAVSTLVESLIKQNEIYKELNITVVTSFNKTAKEQACQFLSTSFIWFKYNRIFYLFDKLISKKNYLRKICVIKFVQRLLRKEDFDIIVLQNSGYLLNIFSNNYLLNKYKNKIFYHLHNDVPNNINTRIARKCNFLLISNYLKTTLSQKLGTSILKNCLILKNGIDIKQFMQSLSLSSKKELRDKLGIPSDNYIIIFVGRITKEKGIIELLNAFKNLSITNITLLLVGSVNFGSVNSSKFEVQLYERIKSIDKQICITGFIHNKDLWKYYQLADLAVLPSIWEEPAGLTMLESVISGLPLITTNSGGIPEYIGDIKRVFLLNKDEALERNITKSIEIILSDDEYKRKLTKTEKYLIAQKYSEQEFYINFLNCLNKA